MCNLPLIPRHEAVEDFKDQKDSMLSEFDKKLDEA
jgi:hypothetical protein